MTDTTIAPHVAADLITLAADLLAMPGRSSFSSEASPLIGTRWDQQVPDGVANPYWEIVRRLPAEKSWRGDRPEPDGHWGFCTPEAMRRAYDAGLDRSSLCARYAWSIPSPGDIAWIAKMTAGQGVIELGAGAGYWAWQMRQAGLDVLAFDPHPAGKGNKYAKYGPYTDVLPGDESAVSEYRDRVLFLCWPGYGASWAARALAAYRGDLLLFAGEGAGGCTADDDFYAALDKGWGEVGESPLHVTYSGIHCALTAWRRA